MHFGSKAIIALVIGISFFSSTSVLAQDTEPNLAIKTPSNAGSLWDAAKTRAVVGMEGNARQKGDLITVLIDERASSQISAGTQTSKDSQMLTSVSTLFGLRQKIIDANPGLGGQIEMETANSSSFLGDGNTLREGSVRGQITCRVISERDGNLVIFGWKQVRSNRETQYLSLSGIVRPQDIRNDNTISSQVIAEAKIEYTGAGVVADKQGPGLGVRILDHIWPF